VIQVLSARAEVAILFGRVKTFFNSKTFLWLLEIILTAALVFALVAIWVPDISIDTQYVPTILSGLTSAMSLLIGFGIACLTVSKRYHSLEASELVILQVLLTISLIFIFGAYGSLIFKSDFALAVRLILSGFLLSIVTVSAVLFVGLKEVW
jgi:hypothetical protein